MRIAIFEMEHFEVAYPLIRLFDYPGNQITIFTSKTCFSHFQELFGESIDKYDFILQTQESKLAFIYTSYKAIRQQQVDLLILSTVSDNFIFYYLMISQLKTTRILLTLHDINSFFFHKFTFSLRRLVRIAGKKLLINRLAEFNVIAIPLVNELKKRIPVYKKVHCLPGSVFEPRRFLMAASQKRTFLQLVVPGSIDEKRRDYEFVLSLLHKIKEKSLPVRIILLGTVWGRQGQEIVQRLLKHGYEGHSIAYYPGEETVDQRAYDRVLQESDLIFIPAVIETVMSDDIQETYGITKSSGTLFDVVRHAKPFIIPRKLVIDPFLETSAYRYDGLDDIIKFLEQLNADPEQLKLMGQKAQAASSNYTIEKVRLRNPDLFPFISRKVAK